VAAERATLPGTLVVERPVAEGVYGERAILYSDDPGRRVLKQYHYSFWLKSPPQLVQDYLVDALRRRQLAERVVEDGVEFEEAHRLVSRITRFERLRAPDQVAVGLEVMLLRPGEYTPALIRRYSEIRPLADEGLTAAVAGFEAALDAVADRLQKDLDAFNDNNTMAAP
jgi:ABC-type uncharacterized transport system auxiliary subunit